MSSEISHLLENSLYADENERQKILKNESKYATAFWCNVLGFIGLKRIAPKSERLSQYLKSGKVKLDTIDENSNDLAISIRIAYDAGVLDDTIANQLTKLVALLKKDGIEKIDEVQVRNLINKIKISKKLYPKREISKEIVKFRKGEYSLEQVAKSIYYFSTQKKLNDEFVSIAKYIVPGLDDGSPKKDSTSDKGVPGSSETDVDPEKAKISKEDNKDEEEGERSEEKVTWEDFNFNGEEINSPMREAMLIHRMYDLTAKEIKQELKKYNLDLKSFRTICKNRFPPKSDFQGSDLEVDKLKSLIEPISKVDPNRFTDFHYNNFYQVAQNDNFILYYFNAGNFDPNNPKHMMHFLETKVPVKGNLKLYSCVNRLEDFYPTLVEDISEKLYNKFLNDPVNFIKSYILEIEGFLKRNDTIDFSDIIKYIFQNRYAVSKLSDKYLKTLEEDTKDNERLKTLVSMIFRYSADDQSQELQERLFDLNILTFLLYPGTISKEKLRDMNEDQILSFINLMSQEKYKKVSQFFEILNEYRHLDSFISKKDLDYDYIVNQIIENKVQKNSMGKTDILTFVLKIVNISDNLIPYDSYLCTELIQYTQKLDYKVVDNINFEKFIRDIKEYNIDNKKIVEPIRKMGLDICKIYAFKSPQDNLTIDFMDIIRQINFLFSDGEIEEEISNWIKEQLDEDSEKFFNRTVELARHTVHSESLNGKYLSGIEDVIINEISGKGLIILFGALKTLIWRGGNLLFSQNFYKELFDACAPKLDGGQLKSINDKISEVIKYYDTYFPSDVREYILQRLTNLLDSACRDKGEDLRVLGSTDFSMLKFAIEENPNIFYEVFRTDTYGIKWIFDHYKEEAKQKMSEPRASIGDPFDLLDGQEIHEAIMNKPEESDTKKLEKVMIGTASSEFTLELEKIEKIYNDAGIDAVIDILNRWGIALKSKKAIKNSRFGSPKNLIQDTKIAEIISDLAETNPMKIDDVLEVFGEEQKKMFDQVMRQVFIQPILHQLYDNQQSEIRPLIDLDAKRVREILQWNNFQIRSRPRKKKDESFGQYVQRVFSNPDVLPKIEDPQVERLDDDAETKEKKTVALNNYANDRHGNTGIEILESFDVNLDTQDVDDFISYHPDTQVLDPVFHGTGSIAASMILRFGFVVINQKDQLATGRMLSDGIYFTPVIDKAAQYLGDSGFTRRHGTVGYILECKIYLGEKKINYDEAGTEGDAIRSPEYAIRDPRSQVHVKRAYKTKIVPKNYIKDLQNKHPDALTENAFKQLFGTRKQQLNFLNYLKEQKSFNGTNCIHYIFRDEKAIDANEEIIDIEEFKDKYLDNENISYSDTQHGAMIKIYTSLDINGSIHIPNTVEFKEDDPGGLYAQYIAVLQNAIK